MFTTVERVYEMTGYQVTEFNLALAQTMIEAYVGKVEADVVDASDFAILGRATAFQAVYIKENPDDVLEQAPVKSLGQNESVTVFDVEKWSPFLSVWVIMACNGLSWRRSRSIKTGPVLDRPIEGWAYRWLYE